TLPRLLSWSQSSAAGIRNFSGTASYQTTFTVSRGILSRDAVLSLDLGDVQVMVAVTLNGKSLGLLWKPPYRVDVTQAVKPGVNTLSVKVTNLWVNRMIADAQLPDDSDRNQNGTLKAWPQWLLDGKPSPTGRTTFTTWRLWGKNDTRQPSGLLGPVTLSVGKDVWLRQ
nr:glycosyl hydrolase family 43 [Armatimonadota bacterium]